jgi:N-acyl-L-homoserine lactone synthetase
MFQVMSHSALIAAGPLRESMLRHRALQFVERHGWSLPLSGGFEIDEFDGPGTDYAVTAEGPRHVASVRLRHAANGSMLERHFPVFWRRHAGALRELHEVTRLCTAPRAASEWRREALGELLVGLCGHCLAVGKERFFGVVYPSVARSLDRAGWRPEIIDRAEIQGESLVLATWTASHRIYWDLQSALDSQDVADPVAMRQAA